MITEVTLCDMRLALINRPDSPFKGSEIERDRLKELVTRSILIAGRWGKEAVSTYYRGAGYNSPETTWARARYFAYQLTQTGLSYAELCGLTQLPDHLIIEHLYIALWEREASELLARKLKAGRARQ